MRYSTSIKESRQSYFSGNAGNREMAIEAGDLYVRAFGGNERIIATELRILSDGKSVAFLHLNIDEVKQLISALVECVSAMNVEQARAAE